MIRMSFFDLTHKYGQIMLVMFTSGRPPIHSGCEGAYLRLQLHLEISHPNFHLSTESPSTLTNSPQKSSSLAGLHSQVRTMR